MIKNILKTTCLICTCLALMPARAQQLPQVSNFSNNQLIFNPAAAGMYETDLNVNLLSRLQWSGIDGAPTYHMFWTDYRFGENKSAVGLNINLNKFGVTKMTEVLGNYSYKFRLSQRFHMSLGLRVGANMIRVDELPSDRIWDAGDPFAEANVPKATLPMAGGGFRISDNKFYIGLSAPDLIASDKNNLLGNDSRSFFKKKRNYVLMSGYKFKLSDAYALSPNLIMVYFPTMPLRTDVNVNFEIRDYFWAGATYSTSKFHSLLVGTHISSTLRASYAFQFGAGKDIPSRFYTHEISLMLNLDVRKK